MSTPYDSQSTSQSSRKSSFQSDDGLLRTGGNSRLRPEDAIYGPSPPRHRPRQSSPLGRSDTVTTATAPINDSRRRRDRRRGRSSSRRKAGPWKKLLWVKQNYPDNYTDEDTFLDHLQWNPRLRPYEFWPLVADSTIIVQHVCSVVIFVCCFTGIFQARVSPQTVVGWATVGTVAGWIFRDLWQSQDTSEVTDTSKNVPDNEEAEVASTASSIGSAPSSAIIPPELSTFVNDQYSNGGGTLYGTLSRMHSRDPSAVSLGAYSASAIPNSDVDMMSNTVTTVRASYIPPYQGKPSSFSPRMQERLTTAKSALLIYCSLLGLSPILRSLTKSTSSDSIWALSSWLMILNVFTFDYGAGPEAKFPASLSTNAALMASTVLASRLPTTTHVFSLTLFSIEVFGLFPVFRRHLRHHSWTGHLCLTTFLVVMAGAGLSMTISGGGWGFGMFGVVLGGVVTGLSMGMTSWWLIGLQRYKNEIRGPWDPAKPVIRRGWD
ncbi:glycosylphosphatidylinositol anchor biosynthesis [Recurvomyces mirabilis]|uniref:Glycosylphosphatidylinositol anchor biosynthesis n=1 Tax=Recurvomyces mirabilis TaxID=574656 RepID=A0AAE0TNE7_9PEZI|nr:glycosylphosphatidylinositol anchor biosynthesis [Recurvomyces mirabilis]KAK5154295.1 glycosylphosphatidylinositol anchor biosynthesis [Recurvomyces mirabilis]